MRIYLRTWRTPDGEVHRAQTYSLLYSIGGVRHHQSLHTRDRRAAELIAADVVRKAELRRAGVRDPFEDHRERPALEHLGEFLTTIRARGVVAKYLAEREAHVKAFLAASGAKSIADLDVARASAWLQGERDRGLSARSVNGRRAALVQFSGWLKRTRRVAFDPLEGLQPLNEAEDRRHVRRALTPDEAARLIEATRARAIARAGTPHPKAKPERRERQERTRAKMTRLGEARALIYLIALGTGLRRGEIARLRWCDVDLDGARVSVPASSAKSRRDQAVDLHPAVVAALDAWRPEEASPGDTVLPPRSMPNSLTFARDVEAAGIASPDASGRVVDFHALRHTAITWVARGGAASRIVQAVARHASLRTTERYLDLHLFDTKGAVERMPLPGSPPAVLATG